MDNIYKAVQLTIDSQNLALSKKPTHVYIANQYVDTNDTPLITAPFIIQKALENGTGVVDIVSSTIGSIYEVRLLCDAEVLISGYFYMPPMNAKFSELELYTSYPPRTPPVVNEFWQKTENFILEKTNTLLNFVQVFNSLSSMRLSLGCLEELLTTKKSNLVSAINEVVSVKADKATTLLGYGITDAYTKSEIDTNYGGVKTLYNKNVAAGAGANGWTDLLIQLESGRTQREKNKDSVSVKDFGALGDGITDDTVAFQKAIDYMMTNGVGLKIPKSGGKYIINGSVTNTSGGVIDIVADIDAEIDGSNSTAALLFLLGGNISTTNYQLTADSAKGSVTIVAPGHNFAAGDIIRVQSTDLWNPTRAYYYKGEMCRVQAVSGDNIYVDTALYDSYTAATTVVTKYNASKCRIDNLKIRRASNQGGLQLQYLKDYSLNNLDIKNANERCLYLLECFNGTFYGNQTYGKYYTNAGTAYGLCIGSCQHLKMFGGYYNGGRHGVAIGGTFPVRDVKMFGVDVDNDGASPQYCMDSHGNAEFIELYGCHIHNAAFLQSINTKIIGGEYRTSSYLSSALTLAPEVSGKYLQMKDVFTENINSKSTAGIVLYENDLVFDKVVVDNVICKGTKNVAASGYGSMFFIKTRNANANATIKNIYINNLDSEFSSASTGADYALGVGVGSNITADVILANNNLAGRFDKTRSIFISVSGTIKSSNNTYVGGDVSNYASVVSKGVFKSVNDTFDCNNTAVYHFVSTTDNVEIINPTIANSASFCLRVNGAADVMISNPTFKSVANPILVDTTIPYAVKSVTGQKILYGATAPSKGTWSVGDKCINKSATANAPLAWICTTAGTPGTWIAESFLGTSTVTTANLQAASHAINTTNKVAGKQVINTTDNKLYYATGTADTDAWRSVDGATVITPDY